MKERDTGESPYLSQEEEVNLAKLMETGRIARVKLARNPNINGKERPVLETQIRRGLAAREKLIISNLGLVRSSAWHYLGRGMGYWDIYQNGAEGLIRAVDKFDYRRGHRLSTLAVWWIHSRISESFGKMKHRDANGKLSLSLDAPLKDDSGNDTSLGELLPENTLSVEEKVEESIRHQTIIEALENLLIPQQKKVILKRYFEGVPVGEVAEEMKIHSVTVHKIKRKAFDTIRKSPYAAALQNSSD